MTAVQRVLACDDSLTIRRLCSMVASNLGIHMELATSAAEAVSKAQAHRPDLILLDYVLPDGRGHDVVEQLQKHDATAQIPIVMMSAKGESLIEQLGGCPAVTGYLTKPFRPQDLEQLLRSHTGRAKTTPTPSRQTPADATNAAPPAAGAATGEGILARLDDQALAKVLFKVLRGELGRVNEWLSTPGTRPDAAELAKRLIKPAVVRDLRTEIEAACPPKRRGALGFLEACRPMVPERCPGFSTKVSAVPLRDQERSLLGFVDGERTLLDIERDIGWSQPEVAAVFDAVAGLGLVRLRTGLLGGTRPTTLWLVDDLPGEFATDLAHHLGRYGRRWTLVRVRIADLAEQAARGLPDGVLVRCTSPEGVAQLRAVPGLDRVPLAAIYDDNLLAPGALLGAGADMALALPVRTSAIDSFLGSAGTS